MGECEELSKDVERYRKLRELMTSKEMSVFSWCDYEVLKGVEDCGAFDVYLDKLIGVTK